MAVDPRGAGGPSRLTYWARLIPDAVGFGRGNRPGGETCDSLRSGTMKQRMLASVAALAASAGLAWGQAQSNAPSAVDPAAVPIPGVLPPGGVIPVIGSEALYYQGGPPDDGMQRRSGGDGCGGCNKGWCGFRSGCGNWCQCGDGSQQIHKAAGGPDCFYYDIEYVSLYFRSMPVAAPMLSAGPIGSSARPGVEDGVTVLFGGQNVDLSPHATLRQTMGFWGQDRCWGMEVSAFLTEQKAEVDHFEGPINGRTVLARPNINALTGVPDSVLISSPPLFGGSAGVYTNTRSGGAELNFLKSCAYYDKFKFNLLGGFRWMVVNEQLRVDSHSVLTDQNPPDPPVRDITDNFTTRNNFYGLQAGFQTEWRHNRCFVDATFKVAGGFTHEKLDIHGSTRFVDGGIENIVPFGVFALEPNSGSFSSKKPSYLPEGIIKVGYQWTQRLSTYVGYDGMYLSNLVRPGNQVNPVINPTLLPISQAYNPQFPFGPPQPALLFSKSDFYMQGLMFGLSYRY
jgi:Putative beta barrel porin-7 (BBP7)